MTINPIQIQAEETPPSTTNRRALLQGAIGFSAGLAFYCGLQLVDSALLTIKENFSPDLLDIEERLDFERANFELELEDLRSDSIDPLEAAKAFFMVFSYLSYLSKVVKLGNLTGINQIVKEELTDMKEDFINRFKRKPQNPNRVRILRRARRSRNRRILESERGNPTAHKIEVATTALEVVDFITPHNAITNIVTTGKMFSELNKPLANNNTLSISQKIFKIAGNTGKIVSEFTPLPTIGRVFSNVALMTGSLLGIVDRQNAA